MKRYFASSLLYTGANLEKTDILIRSKQQLPPMRRRLLFLADVHLSWMLPQRGMERLLSEIEALSPDMILWGGDYGETYADQMRFFSMIQRLHPPLGMLGVAGNNDLQSFDLDCSALKAAMRKGGIIPLVNEGTRVCLDGDTMASAAVAGLDDLRSGKPSGSALPDASGASIYILLSHNPYALWKVLPTMQQKPDIVLCGHTHGGQISPFGLNIYRTGFEQDVVSIPKPVPVTGWAEIFGVRMLITNGIGSSRFPIRIGAPPQMHLLTLTPGEIGD